MCGVGAFRRAQDLTDSPGRRPRPWAFRASSSPLQDRSGSFSRSPGSPSCGFGLCAAAELNWSPVQTEGIYSILIVRKRKASFQRQSFFLQPDTR